jgi:hypothetical protein
MIHQYTNDFRLTAKVIIGVTLLGLAGAGIAQANTAERSATLPTSPQSAPALMPGQWEIQQTMTGGPDDNQPRLRTTCLTQDTLAADPLGALTPEPPPGRAAITCQTKDVQGDGEQISYETACSLPFGTMKTKWQGTIESERFAVTGQARMMGRSLSTQVSGVRLGECITP